jgi:hypothetical protein
MARSINFAIMVIALLGLFGVFEIPTWLGASMITFSSTALGYAVRDAHRRGKAIRAAQGHVSTARRATADDVR